MESQQPGAAEVRRPACPSAQDLAAYCEGALPPRSRERDSIEMHLAECVDCRGVVVETRRYIDSAGVPTDRAARDRWKVAIAAAGVLAAAAVILLVVWPALRPGARSSEPLQELAAALSTQPTRLTEARTSLAVAYAPKPSPQRGSPVSESPDVRIAAAKIEKLAAAEDTADHRAALGLAHLSMGDFDGAVRALESAANERPTEWRFQLDLSAAYLARAAGGTRPDDWSSALAASERAIAGDPQDSAGYFNRALALEGLHLTDRAVLAWSDYLAHDQTSPWADEARQRLAALKHANQASAIDDRQRVREYIEEVLLPAWAHAVLRNELTSPRLLDDAARQSEELAASGGDALPAAAIRQIRAYQSRRNQRAVSDIASGHALFAEGRAAFRQERLDDAAELMRRASVHFARSRSAYANWGPIYAAISQRASGAADVALDTLNSMRADGLPAPFSHLHGRRHWMRGAALASLGRYDEARTEHAAAVKIFESTGEFENLSANRTHLAEAEWALGERQDAWRHEIEALEQLPRLQVGTRRNVILYIGATFCLEAGLPEAALHFESALIDSLSGHHAGSALADALMQRGEVLGSLGRIEEAKADLRRAERSLAAGVDWGTRDRSVAEIQRARAHVLLVADARAAETAATAALTYFRHSGLHGRLAEAYSARARARVALGNLDEADADFAGAASAYEALWRGVRSPEDRLRAFPDQRDAYREWIALTLRRGQVDRALRICERGRAQSIQFGSGQDAVDPVASRARLGPEAAAIYYVVLQDRLVTWILTAEGLSQREYPVRSDEVGRAVSRLDRAVWGGADASMAGRLAASLLDPLLAPVLDASRSKRILVLLPDGDLWRVPFAALFLARLPQLARDRTVVLDQSLNTFFASSSALTRSAPLQNVVAVGDGHPKGSGLPSLPGANQEAQEVGRLYLSAVTLTGPDATRDRILRAGGGVLHFSGHTIVNPVDPLMSRLLLAPGANGDAALSGSDIIENRSRLPKVVVLGSCESGIGPFIEGEGPASIASFFLAAGAASVIASSSPVDDRSTELLLSTHRYIAQGHDPARALVMAQTQFLSAHGPQVPIRVWGSFAAYGGVPTTSDN